jgi:hypothetical protein
MNAVEFKILKGNQFEKRGEMTNMSSFIVKEKSGNQIGRERKEKPVERPHRRLTIEFCFQ